MSEHLASIVGRWELELSPSERSLVQAATRGSLEQASSVLLRLVDEGVRGRARPASQTVALICLLRLGLLDELLQLLARSPTRTDREVSGAVEYVERLLEDHGHYDTLAGVDPRLRAGTLELLLGSLREEHDEQMLVNLISLVILASAMVLAKMDPTPDERPTLEAGPALDLEVMFSNLAKYLQELPFRASDVLVRATNGLIVGIKRRLDSLVDSETIRESFKVSIETVAERCLVEGRYKSAAMLYSQIEDNVNAVKSLMRAGDVETVVSFALLVRDVTVNRITINYLKHLNVEAATIDDFIARSKL